MNRKIYFNNNYILLAEGEVQQTDNQVIITTEDFDPVSLKIAIQNFIQQSEQKPLVFLTKNLNEFFEKLKSEFKYLEAAGGLIKKEEKYLFIYRLDKWDLPKGKIDPGETSEDAAVRECIEECAIDYLSIQKELPSTYHIYEHKGRYVLKRTFWYLMTTSFNETLIPQTEENIEKAEWLSKEQIQTDVLQNTYPSILDLISVSIPMN
jgi:8-oxo-dGTP pyrophosphatase MutT (NUDIX family)